MVPSITVAPRVHPLVQQGHADLPVRGPVEQELAKIRHTCRTFDVELAERPEKVIGTTVIIRVAIETGMRKVREIVGMDADTYDA